MNDYTFQTSRVVFACVMHNILKLHCELFVQMPVLSIEHGITSLKIYHEIAPYLINCTYMYRISIASVVLAGN